MIQKIFIIGASGNVGRELVKQVITNDTIGNHVNPTSIIGMTNSKYYVFNSRGFKSNKIEEVTLGKKEAEKYFEENGKKLDSLISIVDLVKKEGLNGEVIFVDVTSGKEELLKFHKYIITNSQNFLVTANKNPISLYNIDDFNLLNKYTGRYDTNTTVMGGAGVLNFVNERINKIADPILKIKGMFSGTLGYIMSELEKLEKPFSEIVKEAKEKGYTEPNPWDDLNGLDVARKLIILARYCSYNVDLNNVKVTPLIDNKYADYDGDEFMNAIKEEDKKFEKLVKEKKDKNEVLRYVGELYLNNGKLNLSVGLTSVPKNSDLGTLAGTSNIAIIETEILKEPYPHVIKSRGAGLAVTAASVRIGIAKMLPNYIISR